MRPDARTLGLDLESCGAQDLARVRADFHQERFPMVLLGAVRAAPPRDDACRGHDGARQGMVEAHAA